MDRDLYYCTRWKHKKFAVKKEKYQVCVSPKIDGNNQGTTIQYHIILHQRFNVCYIGELNKYLTSDEANYHLSNLEQMVRRVFIKHIQWCSNVIDKQVVKIWYFDEKESVLESDDKRIWPPLRFVATAVNIEPLDKMQSKNIQSELEEIVMEWVKKLNEV